MNTEIATATETEALGTAGNVVVEIELANPDTERPETVAELAPKPAEDEEAPTDLDFKNNPESPTADLLSFGAPEDYFAGLKIHPLPFTLSPPTPASPAKTRLATAQPPHGAARTAHSLERKHWEQAT